MCNKGGYNEMDPFDGNCVNRQKNNAKEYMMKKHRSGASQVTNLFISSIPLNFCRLFDYKLFQ